MEKLTLKELAGYLPYGLKQYYEVENPNISGISFVTLKNINELINYKEGGKNYFKPILYPLSMLTQEIEHNGEKFVPIEYFEIGDDNNYSFEFDSGNIKLINTLKDISKNNIYFDIKFLPHTVVEKLYEWNFDLHNLIDRNLGLDKTTLNK